MNEELKKALRTDKEVYCGWQANIAMAFVDAVHWKKKERDKKFLNKKEIHEAANDAAKNFLDLMIIDAESEE